MQMSSMWSRRAVKHTKGNHRRTIITSQVIIVGLQGIPVILSTFGKKVLALSIGSFFPLLHVNE